MKTYRVIKIENGWATVLFPNGFTWDFWDYPRELKVGDELEWSKTCNTRYHWIIK